MATHVPQGSDPDRRLDVIDITTASLSASFYSQSFRVSTALHLGNGARLLSGSLFITRSTRTEVSPAKSCGNSGRSDAMVVLRAGPRALIAPIGGGMVDFSVSIVCGKGGGIDTACRLGATATDVQGKYVRDVGVLRRSRAVRL